MILRKHACLRAQGMEDLERRIGELADASKQQWEQLVVTTSRVDAMHAHFRALGALCLLP